MPSKFKKPKIVKAPTKAITRLENIAKEMDKPGSIKVGLPKGSNPYPDGTSVIMVGAVNEFGSIVRGIPERSFLRWTVQANRRKYKALFKKIGAKVGTGDMTSVKAMSILGEIIKSDVQERIRAVRTPPNAPLTVLEKGSSSPLIDTGHLRQSITWILNK